jgi:hypothetical protein
MPGSINLRTCQKKTHLSSGYAILQIDTLISLWFRYGMFLWLSNSYETGLI